MSLKLYDYQIDAINKMKNGCILNGGVGTGKSLTSLGYYYLRNGGSVSFLQGKPYKEMKHPKDLYIITTARKRDTFEWEGELIHYMMSSHSDLNYYKNQITIDSWNNIKKYAGVKNAFFIFDEQRVVGYGAWTKAFLKIAKVNEWILLSATPGDTWQDYIPVFIANGFYKNKSDFVDKHVIYDWRVKNFPKIDRYINTKRLVRLRDSILIDMEMKRSTVPHHETVDVNYDISEYKHLFKDRWDIWNDKPIESAAELCYDLRKIVNSDDTRSVAVLEIFEDHPKVIIFYNFDYELEILKSLYYGENVEIAEWNGHKHQPLPVSNSWVYLVQYTAGCEGWNCITTDTIIFYSQNYSYKVMSQAAGRIDRLNTPFIDLYYYHLKSKAGIDLAIGRALSEKRKFNEGKFARWEK